MKRAFQTVVVQVTIFCVWTLASAAQEPALKPPPGPDQQALQRYVGKYEVRGTIYPQDPNVAPAKLEGTSEAEFLAGSPWIVTTTKFRVGTLPVEAVRIHCYDVNRGRFASASASSAFPPSLEIAEGVYDADKNTMRWTWPEGPDPLTGDRLIRTAEDVFNDDGSYVVNVRTHRLGSAESTELAQFVYQRSDRASTQRSDETTGAKQSKLRPSTLIGGHAMTTNSAIPAGMSVLTPRLVCRDPSAEIAFIAETLDAQVLNRRAGQDGKLLHALLKIGPAMLMVESEWPETANRAPQRDGSSPVVLYLYVENVDKTVEKASAKGGNVLAPPKDQFWGDRTAWIMDPAGHVWTIAQRIEQTSAEERDKRWDNIRSSP